MKTLASLVAIRGEILSKTALLRSARTAVAAVASLLTARCCRLPETYWAPITTLVVTQSSLRETALISAERLIGTALGAIAGVIVASRYGSSFIMFGISVFVLGLLTSAPHFVRSAYRFAGITLAIVMLVPSTDSPRRIAFHRFVEVCIGIGVALVLTVFWPEREEPHINTRDPNSLKISGKLMRGRTESNALLTSVRYLCPRTIIGHDVEGEAIGSVTRQTVVKPKRWKLFLLTVAALYPLTLLIPEVLRILSHVISPLTEGVVRGILASALLVASVMFVIIPFCNRVFKKWLNS